MTGENPDTFIVEPDKYEAIPMDREAWELTWIEEEEQEREGGSRDPSWQQNAKYQPGQTKLDYSCTPGLAIEEMAHVMVGGADKYGYFNWRENGVDARTYYSAIVRHLKAWFHDLEDHDPDDKRHPLAHVMACCGIIIDCHKLGLLHDNRPPNPKGDE